MCVLLQVGLEGVLLSSCSAAGIWRVRDLAGLGRDDLFSGLRYALSWLNTRTHTQTEESVPRLNHMQRSWTLVTATYWSLPCFHFTCSAHLFGTEDGWAHAEEGRASRSSASTRGLRLMLQAEPGRGGWWLDPRRWTAIFNRTALVGLWTNAATRVRKACRMWGWCEGRYAEGTKTWRNEEVREDNGDEMYVFMI